MPVQVLNVVDAAYAYLLRHTGATQTAKQSIADTKLKGAQHEGASVITSAMTSTVASWPHPVGNATDNPKNGVPRNRSAHADRKLGPRVYVVKVRRGDKLRNPDYQNVRSCNGAYGVANVTSVRHIQHMLAMRGARASDTIYVMTDETHLRHFDGLSQPKRAHAAHGVVHDHEPGLGKVLFMKDVPSFASLLHETNDNYQLYLAELTLAKRLQKHHPGHFVNVLYEADKARVRADESFTCIASSAKLYPNSTTEGPKGPRPEPAAGAATPPTGSSPNAKHASQRTPTRTPCHCYTWPPMD